jgi:hypothetical protein
VAAIDGGEIMKILFVEGANRISFQLSQVARERLFSCKYVDLANNNFSLAYRIFTIPNKREFSDQPEERNMTRSSIF